FVSRLGNEGVDIAAVVLLDDRVVALAAVVDDSQCVTGSVLIDIGVAHLPRLVYPGLVTGAADLFHNRLVIRAQLLDADLRPIGLPLAGESVVAIARLSDGDRGVAAAAALFHHGLVVVAVDDLHGSANRTVVPLIDVVVVAVSLHVDARVGVGVVVLKNYTFIKAAGLRHGGVVSQRQCGQGQRGAQGNSQCGQFAVHILLLSAC